MEPAFGILKPDCIERKLEDCVLDRVTKSGLAIVTKKIVRLTPEDVAAIWFPCVGEYYFPEMVRFSTLSDCMAFVVVADEAIKRLTELVGHFDPCLAEPESIRGRFATCRMRNVIHSCDSVSSTMREIKMFFE